MYIAEALSLSELLAVVLVGRNCRIASVFGESVGVVVHNGTCSKKSSFLFLSQPRSDLITCIVGLAQVLDPALVVFLEIESHP